MFVSDTKSAPVRELDGLSSKVLLEAGDGSNAALAVTWVDVLPGAGQKPHSHDPQQVYVIVTGSGRMCVGGERRDVSAGDLVFIPSAVEHSIANLGSDTLTYISAATPSFSITDLYDSGQLAG